MGKFVGFFFIAVLANLAILSSASKNSGECKTSTSKSPLYRLKNHVLCGVDSDERPGGKNATAINLILIPTLSHFDEDTGNLELHSLMYVEWIDDRLKWDSTLFENITGLTVKYWEIWTPTVTHNGMGRFAYITTNDVYNIAQCHVMKRGIVRCLIETVNNIKCDTDFTYWPYDRQNCTMVLASWVHSGEELTINEMSYHPIIVHKYGTDPEWTLYIGRIVREQKSMYIKDSKTLAITIDFILDRTTGCFRGQVISPAIIMMVMTIVTTYLAPLSIDRFAVGCSSVVIHMLCIMNLNWTVPHNGETVPNILLFYCNSLVLATIALLLTFVLGKIETKKTIPPKWITSYIVWILRNKYGQIFLLSIFEIGDPRPAADVEATADDTGALVNSNSKSKNLVWRYVSILFLRISYFVFILTYCIMFIVLILTTAIRFPPPTVSEELFV